MSAATFRFHFRMSGDAFEALLLRIRDHEAMKSRSETILGLKLACYLITVGFFGNGASIEAIISVIAVSIGTIVNYGGWPSGPYSL